MGLHFLICEGSLEGPLRSRNLRAWPVSVIIMLCHYQKNSCYLLSINYMAGVYKTHFNPYTSPVKWAFLSPFCMETLRFGEVLDQAAMAHGRTQIRAFN